MDNLTLFQFENKNVRMLLIDNEPYFALQDICGILQLNNITTLRERLDQKGVRSSVTPTNGGPQNMHFVNEKNLYRCIFKSKKKSAENFQNWVFDIVLPTIRKTGTFAFNNEQKALLEYSKREVQLEKSKEINALQFALGGVEAIKEYNRANCKQVTGLTTQEVKTLGKKIGLKSIQRTSAKEVLRNVDEFKSKACVMALNDNIVAKNPKIKLKQLQEMDRNADLTFNAMLKLGINPQELN